MTRSKSLTNYILSHYLIPVPKQQFFNNDDFNKVFDFIKIIGYPVCIKDEYGCEGNDVFPDLRSDSEVCNIIKYLSNKKKSYVIEEYVYGDAYRLYIVGEKIISIRKTSTPYLIGDGISSIKELIVKYNDSFKDKEKDTFDFYRNLQLDYEIENRLKRDGLSLSSILKKDDKYKISANLKVKKVIPTWIKKAHPAIHKIAINAFRTIGLQIGAIDLVTTNIMLDPY